MDALSIRGINYYPAQRPWDGLWTNTPALLLAGPSDNVLESQKPHWHIDHIPPAPVLSPPPSGDANNGVR